MAWRVARRLRERRSGGIRRDVQREPGRRASPVDQQGVEAILGERARGLGIAVRRACEVTGFEQDGEGVDVAWTSPAGAQRMRCGWLMDTGPTLLLRPDACVAWAGDGDETTGLADALRRWFGSGGPR